jgi:prepilin peptidase CpaA
MALAFALNTGTLKEVLQNIKSILFLGVVKMSTGQVPTVDGATTAIKMPYAVAIALGTFSYLMWYRMM